MGSEMCIRDRFRVTRGRLSFALGPTLRAFSPDLCAQELSTRTTSQPERARIPLGGDYTSKYINNTTALRLELVGLVLVVMSSLIALEAGFRPRTAVSP